MNPEFEEFEQPFWEPYELCRYHAIICRERVSRLVRLRDITVRCTCGLAKRSSRPARTTATTLTVIANA